MLEFLIIPGPNGGLLGDLASINIQRARDHGIPGYVTFFELCNNRTGIKKFTDLEGILSKEQRYRLSKVYRGGVRDVDLFPGLLSEIKQKGSELGPTTTCLFLNQFNNTRSGDRFWYERNDTCTGFSIEQLDEIRNTSLARVICDNSDNLATIQPKVFLRRTGVNGTNTDVSCFTLPHVNLDVFKEGKYSFKFAI